MQGLMYPAVNVAAAESWIYPTNYSVRKYQRDISETCLFHNTLVSLPTGMGKTLIAAVVMYNFHRWFPDGIIIFMAPTKPLVSQQIAACRDIMGIASSDIAQMDGSIPSKNREALWNGKKLFFCTPQVVENDLAHERCSAGRIVCVVLDEAHRAIGNYAYVKVIYELNRRKSRFRVLALSATPGSDRRAVQNVLYNLDIAKLEWRAEDDPDVAPFVQERQVEIVRCKPSASASNGWVGMAKKKVNDCLREVARRLVHGRVLLSEEPDHINPFILNEVERTIAGMETIGDLSLQRMSSAVVLARRLAEGRKLLLERGSAALWTHLEDIISRYDRRRPCNEVEAELFHSSSFSSLCRTLRGVEESISTGKLTHKGPNKLTCTTSPKLFKLQEILVEHFRLAAGHSGGESRAIVFVALRSTVQDIVAELNHMTELKAAQFVGQSGASATSASSGVARGQSQKEQEEVLRAFNRGSYNVLVATCIAEEGLDIAEVDLIVSFDVTQSPVRMLQRNGRTARKKSGRVIMLVTEGKEEERVYKSSDSIVRVNDSMMNALTSLTLSQRSPRMLPDDARPVLREECLGAANKPVINASSPRAFPRNITAKKSQQQLLDLRAYCDRGPLSHPVVSVDENSSAINADILVGDWFGSSRAISNPGNASTETANASLACDAESVVGDTISYGSPKETRLPVADKPRRHVCGICNRAMAMGSDLALCGECSSVLAASLTEDNDLVLQGNWVPTTSQPHERDELNDTTYACEGSSSPIDRPMASFSPDGSTFDVRVHSAKVTTTIPRGDSVISSAIVASTDGNLHAYRIPDCLPVRGLVVESDQQRSWETQKKRTSGTDPSGRRLYSLLAQKLGGVDKSCVATRGPCGGNSLVGGILTDISALFTHIPPAHDPSRMNTRNNDKGETELPQELDGVDYGLFFTDGTFPRRARCEEEDRDDIDGTMPNDHITSAVLRQSVSSPPDADCATAGYVADTPDRQPHTSSLSDLNADKVRVDPNPSHIPFNDSQLKLIDEEHTRLPGQAKKAFAIAASVFCDSSDDSSDNEPNTSNKCYSSDSVNSSVAAKQSSVHQASTSPSAGGPPKQYSSSSFAIAASVFDDSTTDDDADNNGQLQHRYQGAGAPAPHILGKSPDVAIEQTPRYQNHHQEVLQPGEPISANILHYGAGCGPNESSPGQYSCYTPSPWAMLEKVDSPNSSERCSRNRYDRIYAPAQRHGGNCGVGGKRQIVDLSNSPLYTPRSAPSFVSIERTPSNVSDEDGCCTQSNDAPCAICTSPYVDERDVGVFCDGSCGLFTHLSCYGLRTVPKTDKFYCDSCEYYRKRKGKKILRCALCQRSGGMLRRSPCKQWVHPLCVFFTPELVTDVDTMLPSNLRELDPDRESLRCTVCQKMGGANVQCVFGDCTSSMHPYCAQKSGKQMVIRCDEDGYPLYELYCDKHKHRVIPDDVVCSTHPIPCAESPDILGEGAGPSRGVRIKGSEDEIWNMDTVDAKPPRHRVKKRLRLRRQASSKKPKKRFSDKENSEDSRRHVAALFDAEAGHGGASDSEDEENDDGMMQDDSFINDGEYTQASANAETGLTMYHALNRQFELTPSPLLATVRYRFRGGNRALPITSHILKRCIVDGEVESICDDELNSTTYLYED